MSLGLHLLIFIIGLATIIFFGLEQCFMFLVIWDIRVSLHYCFLDVFTLRETGFYVRDPLVSLISSWMLTNDVSFQLVNERFTNRCYVVQ